MNQAHSQCFISVDDIAISPSPVRGQALLLGLPVRRTVQGRVDARLCKTGMRRRLLRRRVDTAGSPSVICIIIHGGS